MSGLEDLYREIVLDHYKTPRNRGELDTPPAVRVEGLNPLCGDEVVVYVVLDGDTLRDIKIGGQGCSISQSSASMMSAAVKGKDLGDISELTHAFKGMLNVGDHGHDGDDVEPHEHPEIAMGELEALKGVMKFPSRIKCATLSWNTLSQAIDDARRAQNA
jgi:nitrogen fixation NifU-like protein